MNYEVLRHFFCSWNTAQLQGKVAPYCEIKESSKNYTLWLDHWDSLITIVRFKFEPATWIDSKIVGRKVR